MNPEAMTYDGETVEVTLQERLAEIDATIDELQMQIQFGEAMKRLEANPDYQLVIDSGYLKAEADRITGLIVGDDPIRRDVMENIVEAGLSIRNFKQFIKYKKMDAAHAPTQIEENIQFRKAVTAEYAQYDAIDVEAE
jgi:hypothetical protein